LCRLLVAKKHNFGQILTFGVSCTNPLLPMRAKFGVLDRTHGVHLLAKFCLDRFILSPSGGEKPQFLPFLNFGILWCRQLKAIWESWTRLHNYKPSPTQRHQNRFCTPTFKVFTCCWPFKCNFLYICAAADKTLTDVERRAVPLR